jgi:hypothetical protein
MKHTWLILFIFSIIQVEGQGLDANKLKNAFLNLKAENSLTNQTNYFELFPNSFQEFEDTFGFENGIPAPLYDGHEYIPQFFALDKIDETARMKKCISISIGGEWDADAVNYFQHELHDYILNNVDLNYQILRNRSNSDIESFFDFFFQSIHPVFKSIPKEFKYLELNDKNYYDLIKKSQLKALENEGH